MIAADTQTALQNLRDDLRSARRPGELFVPLDRAALLRTIARVGLAVARDLGHDRRDLDIGAGDFFPPCPVERLAFLRENIGRILSAVNRIGREPPTAISFVERAVPLERARRVSASALRSLAQKPFALSRIQETVPVPTPDTPANRAAKTVLAVFARDTSAIAALAQNAGLPAVFAEAERLRRRLARVLRQYPWRDLPPLPRVPPLAPTLRNAGAHVLLHDIYRRYRGGFAWDFSHPLFTLPERETWQLYEYYTFFACVQSFQSLGFRAASGDVVRVTESGVSLSLATGASGQITLKRGAETVRLTYQKRFDNSGEYRSAAHTLVPDIVLESAGRLLVLDAKFKTYAAPDGSFVSPLDDSRQLHSYRDAVRQGDARPVESAWVLYAGRVAGINRPIIAFPSSAPEQPFGGGEIGAVLLRPGAGHDTLAALLTAFLRGTFAPSTSDRAR